MSTAGTADDPGASRYARRIERRWQEISGTPSVLSPRDWSRIRRWFAEGIPLQLVEETMDELLAADRPRRIADLDRAVRKSWSVVVQGRRIESRAADAPPEPEHDALESWQRRLAEEAEASPLAALLGELIGRRRAGEPARTVDDELDGRLIEAVDPVRRQAAAVEVERRLCEFRSRMDAERFEATRRRAMITELRRALGLARLAAGESRS